MVTTKLIRAVAIQSAKSLIRIINTGCGWNMDTINSCLPQGWEIVGAEDSDFFPCTLAVVSSAYYRFAHKKEKCDE